jgi:hypothetical protein
VSREPVGFPGARASARSPGTRTRRGCDRPRGSSEGPSLARSGSVGKPDRPSFRAPDSSAPDVSASGRIEARRSRRSPKRIKRLRHSSRIVHTKAPRGRWHSGTGYATRARTVPRKVSGTLARRGVPDGTRPWRTSRTGVSPRTSLRGVQLPGTRRMACHVQYLACRRGHTPKPHF